MSESLRGQFLIAGSSLRDPNFFRTVVLIIEHNSSGAMGLVVNRPSSISVCNALSGYFDLPDCEESYVFAGGPVEPAALFVMHNCQELDADETPVVPGLFVNSSADVFEDVIHAATCGEEELQFRIMSGCAGWGPGQLEGELARGDWFSHLAVPEDIFEADPYDLWDDVLQKVYESNRILPYATSHPEWN